MSRWILWLLVLGVGATLLLRFWRGFFWQHAVIIGIAITALVFVAYRTVERLRDLYRE